MQNLTTLSFFSCSDGAKLSKSTVPSVWNGGTTMTSLAFLMLSVKPVAVASGPPLMGVDFPLIERMLPRRSASTCL